MANHDIVVIGASTGGVDVLTSVMGGLPPGLPASLFVVCHFPSGSRSVLPEILSRAGPLLAMHPVEGEPFHPGQVYVAPPDHHLLLQAGGQMQLSRGPRENNHRPAVDPLFRSAASAYGPRVIAVVLSGGLVDGTAGLLAVRAAGGVAVVQDPADAVMASMPGNAASVAGADHVVPAAGLASLLVELIQQPISVPGGSSMTDPIETMPDIVNADMDEQVRNVRRGQVSVFSCPECGGSLWQVDERPLVRFRCHVGHAYNGEVLLAEQASALEAALWTAVRTFKERNLLARQLAARERERGDARSAARFDEQAALALRYGELIQQYVLNEQPASREATAAPLPSAAAPPESPAD
jgi:two-component system chemotaxis response regulator CheB